MAPPVSHFRVSNRSGVEIFPPLSTSTFSASTGPARQGPDVRHVRFVSPPDWETLDAYSGAEEGPGSDAGSEEAVQDDQSADEVAMGEGQNPNARDSNRWRRRRSASTSSSSDSHQLPPTRRLISPPAPRSPGGHGGRPQSDAIVVGGASSVPTDHQAMDDPDGTPPSSPPAADFRPDRSIPSLIRLLLTRADANLRLTNTTLAGLHRTSVRLEKARRKLAVRKEVVWQRAQQAKSERLAARLDMKRAGRTWKRASGMKKKSAVLTVKAKKNARKAKVVAQRAVKRADAKAVVEGKKREVAEAERRMEREAFAVERGVYLETIRFLREGGGSGGDDEGSMGYRPALRRR